MIKSSLRSAGMTECLINFKYMVFGQPIQMDGKYCLSWQASRSINFVLFVLVVATTGWLAPIITSVLLCNRSFRFHPEIIGSVFLFRPQGKQKDKCFFLTSSTWGFHKSNTCQFPGTTKHLSIPCTPHPARQALLVTSVWGCCRCPSPGQPAQERTPLRRRDEATARAKLTLWGV